MEGADISPILVLVEEKKLRREWSAISSKTLWRDWDRLEVHSTILYRRWFQEDTVSEILQLIVPRSRRAEVMEMHHSIPSAAHLDAERIMEGIKNGFYWYESERH